MSTKEKKYDAFGVEIREPEDHVKPDFERSKLLNPIVVADEEHPGTTKVVFEEIDLRSFIAEAAENCGLEYVLKMMKAGQISPEDIADDGKHGVDLTGIPSYIGDLKAKAESNAAQGNAALAQLGIDPSKSYTDDELKQAIADALKPYFENKEESKE